MDWSCTGEQSALSVPHRPLMVVVGLQGAHTCSGGTTGCPHLQWWDYRVPTPAVGGGTVSTPASSLPGLWGSRRLHRTGTMCLLSVQVSWITRCA